MAGLVKAIDKVVADNKSQGLAAVVNFTGERTDAFAQQAKEFGEKHNIDNVALTVTSDGDRFRVSDEADVTVMHYKGKKVLYNYAARGELSEEEIAKIVEGADTIVN